MPSPTVDIIVPVWDNPFETRACLASILQHAPEARLVIIDNCSSRQTQLMLEEIFEPLEDSGLFISSERNIGLVPAINRGLAASDSDYSVSGKCWVFRWMISSAIPICGGITCWPWNRGI